jgi:hypothetical protein
VLTGRLPGDRIQDQPVHVGMLEVEHPGDVEGRPSASSRAAST